MQSPFVRGLSAQRVREGYVKYKDGATLKVRDRKDIGALVEKIQNVERPIVSYAVQARIERQPFEVVVVAGEDALYFGLPALGPPPSITPPVRTVVLPPS